MHINNRHKNKRKYKTTSATKSELVSFTQNSTKIACDKYQRRFWDFRMDGEGLQFEMGGHIPGTF